MPWTGINLPPHWHHRHLRNGNNSNKPIDDFARQLVSFKSKANPLENTLFHFKRNKINKFWIGTFDLNEKLKKILSIFLTIVTRVSHLEYFAQTLRKWSRLFKIHDHLLWEQKRASERKHTRWCVCAQKNKNNRQIHKKQATIHNVHESNVHYKTFDFSNSCGVPARHRHRHQSSIWTSATLCI